MKTEMDPALCDLYSQAGDGEQLEAGLREVVRRSSEGLCLEVSAGFPAEEMAFECGEVFEQQESCCEE